MQARSGISVQRDFDLLAVGGGVEDVGEVRFGVLGADLHGSRVAERGGGVNGFGGMGGWGCGGRREGGSLARVPAHRGVRDKWGTWLKLFYSMLLLFQ